MTIDEAIAHCLEVAEQQEADSFIDRWSDDDEWSESLKENCRQCAADHRQLAEWLMELKEAKRLLKTVVEFRNSGYCTKNCSECVASPCDYIDWFKNMYDNEIEKLIGDELSGV